MGKGKEGSRDTIDRRVGKEEKESERREREGKKEKKGGSRVRDIKITEMERDETQRAGKMRN